MTRFMRKDGNATTTAAAPPEKAASHEISEDEAGMRLDRWLHRRFPEVSNSHLMRIVRKGEVRVSGKRVDIFTRLATGENVRRSGSSRRSRCQSANPDQRSAR